MSATWRQPERLSSDDQPTQVHEGEQGKQSKHSLNGLDSDKIQQVIEFFLITVGCLGAIFVFMAVVGGFEYFLHSLGLLD